MTVLIWSVLVLGVICTCVVLIGMTVSVIVRKVTRSRSPTGMDCLVTAMAVVTVFVDAIAAVAGLLLAPVFLDDPGDRTLAAALGSVLVTVVALPVVWTLGGELISRRLGR